MASDDCISCGCGLYPNENDRCSQCKNAFSDGVKAAVAAVRRQIEQVRGSFVSARTLIDDAERALRGTK